MQTLKTLSGILQFMGPFSAVFLALILIYKLKEIFEKREFPGTGWVWFREEPPIKFNKNPILFVILTIIIAVLVAIMLIYAFAQLVLLSSTI